MQIVLLITNGALADKTYDGLNSKIECNLIEHAKPEDFLSLYQIVPDVEAIICDDEHIEELIQECRQNDIQVDLIYIGDKQIDGSGLNFHHMTPDQDIVNYIENNLNQTCVAIDENDKHSPIPLDYLPFVKTAPCDFFLQVKKDNFFHYIKFLKKGDEIDLENLKNKASKGLKELYIDRDKKSEVIKLFNDTFIKLMSKEPDNSEGSKEEVHKAVYGLLTSVGFSDRSTELAMNACDDLINNLNKGLLSSLNKQFKAGGTFPYKKSYMTSIVALALSRELEWITEENKKALTLAAMFNDISLNQEDMHSIISNEELNQSPLFDADKQIVRDHAAEAAKWVTSQKDIPPEVERIIKQHHGSASGHDFNVEIEGQVTKLSTVFIVCEEFTHYVLMNAGKKINVINGIKAIRNKYSSTTLHKVLDVLEEVLKKEL
jgi:hypothetical protein